MMHAVKNFLFVLPILILISGCASITKNEAETKAVEFVNEKVKFFAREGDSTLDLPKYSIDSVTSYQEDKNWVVVMHVSSKASNETKKNDLMIRLNRNGGVTEFNGKKVIE